MATVKDLSGNNLVIDNKFSAYNRVSAGEPNGLITPLYGGEIVLDTTQNALWEAVGTAINAWVMLTPI